MAGLKQKRGEALLELRRHVGHRDVEVGEVVGAVEGAPDPADELELRDVAAVLAHDVGQQREVVGRSSGPNGLSPWP